MTQLLMHDEGVQLANAFFELDSDITACTEPSTLHVQPYTREDYTDGVFKHTSVRDMLDSSFTRTIAALDHPALDLDTIEPVTTYGQKLKALSTASTRKMTYDSSVFFVACLEAEPRLTRSLARHKQFTERQRNYTAAFIHYDVDGEPYGYQKASGVNTLYAWRDARIRTEEGTQTVLADSFLDVHFNEAYNPRQLYRGLGLVSLEDFTELPLSARFIRFGLSSLPDVIKSAVQEYPRDWKNDTEKPIRTPEEIGEFVIDLISKGKAKSAQAMAA